MRPLLATFLPKGSPLQCGPVGATDSVAPTIISNSDEIPMLKKIMTFYNSGNRWYLPLLAGLSYALGTPPFNAQLHPAFTIFPLLSFFVCVPLFALSLHSSIKRALLHTYLFGLGASLGQLYWIAFVMPEGLWPLVIGGVAMLTCYEALFFTINGMVFRFTTRRLPRWSVVFVIAAWWVLVEYARSLGEMSFPWNFIGYSLTPLLPLAQISSITGIYGMSFLVVMGNVLAWQWVRGAAAGTGQRAALRLFAVFAGLLVVFAVGGWMRLNGAADSDKSVATVSLVQPCIDQNHWGNGSLDTSFDAIESMVQRAAITRPDVIVLPESALLCYLVKRQPLRNRVIAWSKRINIPIVLGSLDWEIAAKQGKAREYDVYNAAFLLDTGSTAFQPYYKAKLVPFSEALPFQGIFPILSRVNVGQADFKAGTKPVVYSIADKIHGAPFICFDIIYPAFVRNRANAGANVLMHITNDGWFGKSSGPFQHALMSQQRCIENGISLLRCANSGISMLVDQYGRILSRTRLEQRTILTGSIPLTRIRTVYSKVGDWPVALSGIIVLLQVAFIVYRKIKK